MPKATVENQYKEVIDTTIAGIPAKIGVTYYCKVAPWRGSVYSCPSDADYYGYLEVDYDVLDRKGYHAAWLEKKLTREIKDEIEGKIVAYMEYDDDY